jgi:mannan endo-1,4-beta-mannosidase
MSKGIAMPRSCSRILGRLLRTAIAIAAIPFAGAAHAQGQALLGVYYGNQGWKMDQVRAMETWQGRRHAVVNLFTDWCNRTKTLDNLFGQQLPGIWTNGNVPVVSWEPYLCSTSSTPNDVEVRAARGDYDAYLRAWADRMKAFVSGPDGSLGTADDRRVYIRLAHEMNGNWYPWGAAVGGNSAADYILMWHRVRGIFWEKGLDARTVQWIWAVNHEDVGVARAEDYYPGDAYVDWIGIDGYNWGASQSWSTWTAPDAVFGPMVARLRSISTRPLALTETASSSVTPGAVNVAAKSQWITQLFAYATAPATQARMIVWFNEDKEADWAVFGGSNGDETYRSGRTNYKAYASYRAAVRAANLIPSSAADPRLMSDLFFAGLW